MPVSLRYGLPLVVIGVLVAAYWPQICDVFWSLLPGYARVEVLDHEGKPMERVHVRCYAVDITSFGPSPTSLLAEADLDAGPGGLLELGKEYIPEKAFVVISAEGHGVDYRQVRRGSRKVLTLELGKPIQVPGTVRSVAGKPIEGARVQAIGGGDPRGPLLREAVTDKAGSFTIPDLSEHTHAMQVRVLKEGYGVAEKTWNRLPTHRPALDEEKEQATLDFELRPVPPATGRVLLPEGLPTADLEIRVHQLPGVRAGIDAGGNFTVHHLAWEDATVFRLLVGNLPAGYTHRRAMVRPGERDVTIAVYKAMPVTGNVIEAGSQQPLTGGLVSHEHGPRGGEQCPLGPDGGFSLEHVPPGDIELRITLHKSDKFKEGGVRLKTVRIEDQGNQKPLVLWIH